MDQSAQEIHRPRPRSRKADGLPTLMAFLLACLLPPTLIVPAAHAVCKSPKNVCKHISDCLDRTVDVVRVKTRNGKMVWAGADACTVDLGIKKQWDKWSGECSDLEYVTIAKAEIENGKALCDRYSQ
jgi:hypothetical protein